MTHATGRTPCSYAGCHRPVIFTTAGISVCPEHLRLLNDFRRWLQQQFDQDRDALDPVA